MAGAGYLLFTAGQVLTAAQVNTYLNQQSVMVFATTAARDAALTTVKSEGMVTYQLDNNDLDIYNGSSFSTLVAPAHGVLTVYTPAVVQLGSVTTTTSRSTYIRVGRQIIGDMELTVTGSGTANNAVTVSTPVTAAYAANGTNVAGAGWIRDESIPNYYATIVVMKTTGTFAFITAVNASSVYEGQTGGVFAVALASPDRISFHYQFEAAADA